jgi:hypothetical protein
MHVYRRPYDHATQSARIFWLPVPEWQINAAYPELEITTYPCSIGPFPTIDVTSVSLTLTTYPCTIGSLFTGDASTANLVLTTYPATIAVTAPVTDPWTGETDPTDTWTEESSVSDTWTPVTNPTGSWT